MPSSGLLAKGMALKSHMLALALTALCLLAFQSMSLFAESSGLLACAPAEHCEDSSRSHEPSDEEDSNCCCIAHCSTALAELGIFQASAVPVLIGTLAGDSAAMPPGLAEEIDHPPRLS